MLWRALAWACWLRLLLRTRHHVLTRARPRSVPRMCDSFIIRRRRALASRGLSVGKCCTLVLCVCVFVFVGVWCGVTFFLYCCGSRSAVPCLCWAVWALFLAWCWCRLLARVMLCVRGRLVRRSWVAVAWLCALCRAWVCGWGAFVVARCSVACAACEETGV